MLGKMLYDLQVGVCIVTETHLRETDIDSLKFPTYHVVAHYCRPTPKGSRIGGGVLILVHVDFVAETIPKNKTILPVIENCSVKLYPTTDPRTAVQITGVYISPSHTHQLRLEQLQNLNCAHIDQKLEDSPPLLLAGDFNATSWSMLYMDWLQEEGLNEMVNPEKPTYALGSAIDKFIFLPGYYVPSTFLPTEAPDLAHRDTFEDPPLLPGYSG